MATPANVRERLEKLYTVLNEEMQTYASSNKEPKAYQVMSALDMRLFGLRICLHQPDLTCLVVFQRLVEHLKQGGGVKKMSITMFRPARTGSKRLGRHPETCKADCLERRQSFEDDLSAVLKDAYALLKPVAEAQRK